MMEVILKSELLLYDFFFDFSIFFFPFFKIEVINLKELKTVRERDALATEALI